MSHQEVDSTKLAEKTEGFTGADLENLCREVLVFNSQFLSSQKKKKIEHFKYVHRYDTV